jgi:plasmid stabilization system protein ParE
MFEIEWTTPAFEDLRRIDAWLDRNGSADYAVRLLATIKYRAKWLVDFPRGGRPLSDGTRILRVYETPYIIRYRVLEDVGKLQVLRVHHERQDWSVES